MAATMLLQVIARHGRWNLPEAMFGAYLQFFKPEALLTAAGWPGASEKDFGLFWAPRFCVQVPESLIYHLFPWLAGCKEGLQELGAHATPSQNSAPTLIKYLAAVLVQDSLELMDCAPDNPVHQYLSAHEDFQCVPVLNDCVVHFCWSN